MNDWRAFFEGKRITLMGLGLLGRGVGDAEFLARAGADLIVTDLKTKDELAPSVARLKGFSNVRFALGGHALEDFRDRDLIIMAPKTPLDSPYVAEARKHGIRIAMSTALFARFAGIPVIGVTGTRGKTTVTHMIARMLEQGGQKVLLGGNIQGVSTLSFLPDVTPESVAVLELDSWQLQGFREEKLSPGIAVFTTFYPDHMDYYHDDMDAYLADKAEVFLHQEPSDTLVVSEQAAPILKEKYGSTVRARLVIASPDRFPKGWALRIPGEHNRLNAVCAIEAARAFGVDDDAMQEALESFTGVPGRLELVREKDGVKFYNDTTATTPEATMAALEALDPENRKNVVLIMGGSDKGLDMTAVSDAVARHAKKVILLAGSGTERVKTHLPECIIYDTFPAAFDAAVHAASSGGSVILSPAFASFGMFKNEYDRGEQFNALVQAL